VQLALWNEALAHREAHSAEVSTIAEAIEAAGGGFARLPWSALNGGGEAALGEHAITVRCLQRQDGSMPLDEDEPDLVAWVARSY
jgi:prolyl-tRNA synthetase